MSDIKETQKIKIFFDADGIDMEIDCFIKQIDNDRLHLDFPQDAINLSKHLEEGTEIDAKVFTPVGLKFFESVVIDSPLEGDFVIEFVEDAVSVQRRDYSRSPLKTKLELEISKEMFIASTIDVSGGGIKFFSKEEMDPDQIVKGKLYLRNYNTPISFEAVILDNPSLQPDEYTLSFTSIDEKERDKIVKTCFEIDLALNKKSE